MEVTERGDQGRARFCVNCGTALEAGPFCPGCGQQVRPSPSPPPVAAMPTQAHQVQSSAVRSSPRARWVISPGHVGALACAALVALGCFAPWASALGTSLTGMERDGAIFLPMAVVVAALVVVAARRPQRAWPLVVAAIVAAVLVAGTVYDLVDVKNVIADAEGLVTVAWGLWLTVVASVALLCFTAFSLISRPSAD
jgi:hypothetical protein